MTPEPIERVIGRALDAAIPDDESDLQFKPDFVTWAERTLRDMGVESLFSALKELEREEFAPVKDVLLVNQRRNELRVALAKVERAGG